MPRTRVIYNPNAGTAEQWPAMIDKLRALDGEVELSATSGPDDAKHLAADAARKRFERVVAVGGDGTVNAVVNGLMQPRLPHTPEARPILGILPMGTGNDLPRTLGLPLDPAEAIDTLARGGIRVIDLMKVRIDGHTTWGHNVAAGGFTGQMNEALTDDLKARWGPLAYLRGAVKVLPDLTNYETVIRYDGKPPQPVAALNIIVANGKTAGGGTMVAASAEPDDGLLDVVIVRPGSIADLAGVAARLLAGDYTNSDVVTHRRAKRVEIRSTPGMWFNVDGELLTNRPIVFSIAPAALRVVVP